MTRLLSSVLLAASVAFHPKSVQKPPSVLSSLKPFEGRWKGDFGMSSTKMSVDMTWSTFAGRWDEISYSYTGPQMKLDYRVMMTPNADNTGFGIWMFGNDMPFPDQMKGVMDGKTLNVLHDAKGDLIVKFWIDDQKNLVMSVVTSDKKHTEVGHGVLKPVKA